MRRVYFIQKKLFPVEKNNIKTYFTFHLLNIFVWVINLYAVHRTHSPHDMGIAIVFACVITGTSVNQVVFHSTGSFSMSFYYSVSIFGASQFKVEQLEQESLHLLPTFSIQFRLENTHKFSVVIATWNHVLFVAVFLQQKKIAESVTGAHMR